MVRWRQRAASCGNPPACIRSRTSCSKTYRKNRRGRRRCCVLSAKIPAICKPGSPRRRGRMEVALEHPAILALEDRTVFRGISIGAAGSTVGEVVFNTAMTGYQEILTDPSYSRQLVTLTYPHIGNTGVNVEDAESETVHAAGLIVRDVPRRPSSWRSQVALPE